MYVEPMTGMKAQKTVQQTTKVSNRKQTSAPKAAETNKKESTDGEFREQVQIAKESDESLTLSIMADDQLVDDQKNVNLEKLKKVMEQVVSSMPHYSDAKFGIHEKTNRITIKLVDRDTQEVVKEIPPERTLDLLAKQMEIAGVLVDERL